MTSMGKAVEITVRKRNTVTVRDTVNEGDYNNKDICGSKSWGWSESETGDKVRARVMTK